MGEPSAASEKCGEVVLGWVCNRPNGHDGEHSIVGPENGSNQDPSL